MANLKLTKFHAYRFYFLNVTKYETTQDPSFNLYFTHLNILFSFYSNVILFKFNPKTIQKNFLLKKRFK